MGGRYRVVRAIGLGGMGTVYEGLQIDLGRRVAIENPLHHMTHDDLLKYGLIPEFVGRLPVSVALDRLTQNRPGIAVRLLCGG